jgi:HAMP domain-containing protein
LRQEVPARHANRVAVDHRPDALAFDDEAKGVLRVPMLRRVFAGHQVLDRGPQRRRRIGLAAERRVGERDRAPLAAAADRDDAARLRGELLQPLPSPQVRGGLGLRMQRHQVADLGPQRDEQLALEAAVELLEFG